MNHRKVRRERRPLVALAIAVLTLSFAGAAVAGDPASSRSDLGLVLRGAPFHADVGENVTYRATVRNNGPAQATNVALVNRIPNGTTLVSATASQGSCTPAAPLSCTLGTLDPAQIATVTIVVQTTSSGRHVDLADVHADQTDPRHINNHASAVTIVGTGSQGNADLGLVLHGAPFHADVGENVTYRATVRNNGPAQATNVALVNRIPNGTTLVSATASQGSCTPAAPLSCTLGTLDPAQIATVTIVVQTTSSGRHVDLADVHADQTDPRHINNHASAVTIVGTGSQGNADLGLVLHGAPFRVHLGHQIHYHATIRNQGPAQATSVTFVDRLPRGMALLAVVPSQGTCPAVQATIRCSLGTLGPGAYATVTILARPFSTGRRLDVGDVHAGEADPRHFNNHATALTIVRF